MAKVVHNNADSDQTGLAQTARHADAASWNSAESIMTRFASNSPGRKVPSHDPKVNTVLVGAPGGSGSLGLGEGPGEGEGYGL